MDEDVQTEAEKGTVAITRPIEAEINHNMRCHQDGRKVCLQGYGYNFSRNLKTAPRYSKLRIILAEFQVEEEKLTDDIKTHRFQTQWKDLIFLNENGLRFIFNFPDFRLINEVVHKETLNQLSDLLTLGSIHDTVRQWGQGIK